jgi:hypothetical protein
VIIVLAVSVDVESEPFNVIIPVDVLDELTLIVEAVDVVLKLIKKLELGAETNIPGTIFEDEAVPIDNVFVPDTNEDESVDVNFTVAPMFDQSAYV